MDRENINSGRRNTSINKSCSNERINISNIEKKNLKKEKDN